MITKLTTNYSKGETVVCNMNNISVFGLYSQVVLLAINVRMVVVSREHKYVISAMTAS